MLLKGVKNKDSDKSPYWNDKYKKDLEDEELCEWATGYVEDLGMDVGAFCVYFELYRLDVIAKKEAAKKAKKTFTPKRPNTAMATMLHELVRKFDGHVNNVRLIPD